MSGKKSRDTVNNGIGNITCCTREAIGTMGKTLMTLGAIQVYRYHVSSSRIICFINSISLRLTLGINIKFYKQKYPLEKFFVLYGLSDHSVQVFSGIGGLYACPLKKISKINFGRVCKNSGNEFCVSSD
jgi:hypothetical protein